MPGQKVNPSCFDVWKEGHHITINHNNGGKNDEDESTGFFQFN